MGKRDSFTAFEDIVITLYNRKALDKELLCVMWQGMSTHLEMDSGGYNRKESEDGKTLPHIVVDTLGIMDRVILYVPYEDYEQEELAALIGKDSYINAACNLYFWDVLYYNNDWSTV